MYSVKCTLYVILSGSAGDIAMYIHIKWYLIFIIAYNQMIHFQFLKMWNSHTHICTFNHKKLINLAPNFYVDLFCMLIFYDIGHRLIPTSSSVHEYSSGEWNARLRGAGWGVPRVMGDGVWWRFWAKRCRCCVSNAWLQKCVSLRNSLCDYLQYTCNLWNWLRIKQNGVSSWG